MASIASGPKANQVAGIYKAPAVIVDEINGSDSDESSTRVSSSLTVTNETYITSVTEVTSKIQQRVIQKIDEVNEKYFDDITIDSYLAYIANERLSTLPHRGDTWDKVLKSAEFFGQQIYLYGNSIKHFVPQVETSVCTAISCCQILLELGQKQDKALDSSFSILYEISSLVSQAVRLTDLKNANRDIREDLGAVFSGLIALIAEVAIYYRATINNMTTKSVRIDFFGQFGSTVDRIFAKKEHLADHMWKLRLAHKKYSLDIEAVRRKLRPVDQSGRIILLDRFATNNRRAEHTCEWVQGWLVEFLSSHDQVLTITGPAGFGKTTIANWMKDRLQKPIRNRSYETISYSFPFDNPAQATSLAAVKNLLGQLLERNVGDVKLFEKLVEAFEGFSADRNSEKLENALWVALEVGLKTVSASKSSTIVIVDGLDEITGADDHARENNARAFQNRIHKAMDHTANTRAVTFSRSISHLTSSSGVKHFTVNKEVTSDDVEIFVKQALDKEPQFEALKEKKDKFVDNLVQKANGNFLWASIVLRALRAEDDSRKAFQQIANSSFSKVTEILKTYFGKVDFKNPTTKAIFTLMLAAKRPFTTTELNELLQVNVTKMSLSSERIDVRKHINGPCSYFIVERQGLVQFRHSVIRQFLLDQAKDGNVFTSIREIHSELTTRMLLYAKLCLSSHYEPTCDFLGTEVVFDTFRSYTMMEYVVRNWLYHFRLSNMCNDKGELVLSSHFHSIFPDSVFFALLERACWSHETSITEVISHHDLALRIRIGCFGKNHTSVLQSKIIIGTFYREISKTVEAATCFYEASRIGKAILSEFSTVIVSCTNFFLRCTETMTFTTRTVIAGYREEMIKFMIEICKVQHGKTSDIVIRWYKALAQLYVSIKEEQNAAVIYKELHIIVVTRFGKGSKEAGEITASLGVVLKGGSSKDITQYAGFIFESEDEHAVVDELRLAVIIKLAREYERREEWFLAEQLYVTFWLRISEACRLRKQTIEIQIAKMKIAIAYAEFLYHKVKRTEEASNIIICLWAEYEHYKIETIKSIELILKIKEIGCLFKTFGLLKVAISVFSKIYGWFKASGKHDHEEAISTTVLITEVVEEWTQTITTTKTVTTTETTTTEEIVREVFETTITRCKHSKVDASFFKACMTLINLYILQEKWSEVEVIVRRTLEISWKAVLTVGTEITISGEFTKEIVVLATKLALCYRKQGFFHKAEEIYVRIYRACFRSLQCENVHFTEAYMALIAFYEEHHRHEQAIEIYVEVLQHYRKHLGHSHKLTIKIMYAIGSLSVKYGIKGAYEWYMEIVKVLNTSGHCHHDAFEASIILSKYYYEMKCWTELQTICSVLWKTFVHHHHEFQFTAEIIQVLYERYTYVLQYHAKVEFSVLYKLTLEYCETVTKFAGITAEIVTIAMLALAKICETREEHWHESVKIYEEVIKRITTTKTKTTTVTTTTTQTVKKRLSKMYVTVITSTSSCSHTTVEKAISLCLELYTQFKVEFGCYHETTLSKLKELVILYKKIEKHTEIISILQASMIEIVTQVTTSITLYHAAVTMASIYVAAGKIEIGKKLLYQLRYLIVLHDIGSTKDMTISLGGKVGKATLVFLAAFEMGLKEGVTLSFSEIMADIVVETVLIEQYTRLIKESSTTIEVLLQYGSQLRCFWSKKERTDAVATLDEKLFAAFLERYGVHIKTKSGITKKFYIALLTEMGQYTTSKYDFAHLSVIVSTKKVKDLLQRKEFQDAHDVAQCAFQFLRGQCLYASPHGLSHGYRLAALLAGREAPQPSDTKQREQLLALSREITTHVLKTARDGGVRFVSLQFADLNGLVGLLGSQKNWGELETLLSALWTSREVQRNWTAATVLSVGRALVHARYANGKVNSAIELAEDLAYNLLRARGPLDPEARKAGRLLAALYTSSGRLKQALGAHEEVLRELDEADDKMIEELAEVARDEVELLKRAFARNKGWDKSESRYKSVVKRMERFGVKENVANWKPSGGEDDFGKFKLWEEWSLAWKEDKVDGKKDQRKRVSGFWPIFKLPLSGFHGEY